VVETVVRGPAAVRLRLVDVEARRVVPLADGVSAPPVMLGGLGDFLGGHRYPARIAREPGHTSWHLQMPEEVPTPPAHFVDQYRQECKE